MVRCPKCGRENDNSFRFCLECGGPLPPTAMVEPARSEAEVTRRVETPLSGENAALPDPAGRDSRAVRRAAPPPAPIRAAVEPGLLGIRLPALQPDPGEVTRVRVCPRCNTIVPPGFAFCGRCGARCQPDVPIPPPSPVPSSIVVKPPIMNPQVAPQPLPIEERVPFRGVSTAVAQAFLVQIRNDGREGGLLAIPSTGICAGRRVSLPLFEGDPFLSPVHATFWIDPKNVVRVRDEGSLNGTFLRVREPCVLTHGDIFRLGQELLRYEEVIPTAPLPEEDGTVRLGSPAQNIWGRLCLLLGPHRIGEAYLLTGRSIRLGRERGECVFPDDGFVSGLHAEIIRDQHRVLLRDLGSSNGTFLRIRGETHLRDGDFLLLGQQLFQLRFR